MLKQTTEKRASYQDSNNNPPYLPTNLRSNPKKNTPEQSKFLSIFNSLYTREFNKPL